MQSKKRVSILLVLVVISIIGISLVSAGWFSDLFKIGKGGEGLEGELATSAPATATVNVTPSVNPPRVIFVGCPFTTVPPEACGALINLNLDNYIMVNFTFLATENPPGIANLPGSEGSPDVTAKVDAIFNNTLAGEDSRTEVGCRWLNDGTYLSIPVRNYSCNIQAWYYDTPSPAWTINVRIQDTLAIPRWSAFNSSINFNYVSLYGFKIFPIAVNWTQIALSDVNKLSNNNLTVNNTGNIQIAPAAPNNKLKINATKLEGPRPLATFSIGAGNFTANDASSCATSPFNESQKSTLSFTLNKRNLANSGFRDLTFCLNQVPSITPGLYNSTRDWILINED